MNWQICLVLICYLLIGSCKKETAQERNFESWQLPTNFPLTDMLWEGTDTIWVAAGQKYGPGAVFLSTDAGQSWQMVLDETPQIKDLLKKNNRIYAIPVGGDIFWTEDSGQNWSSFLGPELSVSAKALFVNDSLAYIVGGENFGFGIFSALNTKHTEPVLKLDTLQFELTDLWMPQPDVLMVVGYGVILSSLNEGNSWTAADARGDFYRAAHFVDPQLGYVVGEFGSILKTTDAGASWTKIKKGSTLSNPKRRFRDVYFVNANEGGIAGADGLCWITLNAGASWIAIDNLPKIDYQTISIQDDMVYLSAEDGQLIYFSFNE